MSPSVEETVVAVFHQVWAAFYKWKSSLRDGSQTSESSRPSYLPYAHDLLELSTTSQSSTRNRKDSNAFSTFTLYSGLDLELPPPPTVIVSQRIVTIPELPPHPEYESCTPLHANIFVGDDSSTLPFIPFADDPTFALEDYTSWYTKLRWQEPEHREDPDLALIVIETALELHLDYGFQYEKIDATQILPLKLVSPSGFRSDMLIDMLKQRDIPLWRGVDQHPISALPPIFLPTSLRARLGAVIKGFCGSTNCIVPECSTHGYIGSLPEPTLPKLRANDLVHAKLDEPDSEPCGPNCFILMNGLNDEDPWTETDLDDFKTMIIFVPDMKSCDLAVMVQKACVSVFRRRIAMITDEDIQAMTIQKLEVDTNQLRISPESPPFVLQEHDDPEPGPCNHIGLCDSVEANCLCFKNHVYCERRCQCSSECERRFPGCRCGKKKSTSTCASNYCPCWKASRECIPGVCNNCKVEDPLDRTCRNASIQRGESKDCEVRKSKWGSGLFVREPVKAGDLISEYVGELIYPETANCRDVIAIHLKRSYLFELAGQVAIDSVKGSNATRFINHAGGTQANTKAHMRMVNGDNRIGLFACKKIKAGDEVLFDYGPSFFR